MKWLIVVLSMFIVTPSVAKEINLAHTGEPCKTVETLKKEHPSQHIYYNTLRNHTKCYHVHVKSQTEKNASEWVIPKDATSYPKSRSADVLDTFMQPHMMWFYYDYTKGRAFGGR